MKKHFQAYYQLLTGKGNLDQKKKDHLEVISLFYDDGIIQIENTAEPIHGKEKLKAMEIKNLEGVNSVKTEIKNVIMDEKEGLVWGEMIIKFDLKKSGKKRLEEAFFQKWKDGKICYQRFFMGA